MRRSARAAVVAAADTGMPGSLLTDRLQMSERTVRRDVERLRELGYRIDGTNGRDGGYRLDAGSTLRSR